MTAPEMAPFLVFYAAAPLALLLPPRLRGVLLLLVPVAGGLSLLGLPMGWTWQGELAGYDLTPVRMDELSRLFGYLFHIAAFVGMLYAWHLRDPLQQTAALLYAGSAVGAVFAGDLLTLFLFWEMLSLTSVFLIWARRTPEARRAGLRYLQFSVVSGVLLLTGVLLRVHATGSLAFGEIGLGAPGGWALFLAFGIKTGFPLLHNWLTDSYPEATPTGTVFLSAFTTKCAIYALARGFPGTEALIYIGAVMTCFPIFYAVIENDLRRVLAYSMINQLGFMVTGVGLGTALALNGAVAHAFNDVIFKGLLFMAMGAVLERTGRINGSDLGGLYKTMPKTAALCIVGAASISAFPLFSGFVSKSLVMSAALHEGYIGVWLALLFASAGVFHHAGIKIPFFAFFAHDSGLRPAEAPGNMLAAMTLAAALCIGIGVYPWWLYDLLPWEVGYDPFTAGHVLAQIQLLFFSALAFTWLKLSGLYPPELPSVNLDAEWAYRKALPRAASALADSAGALAARGSGLLGRRFRPAVETLAHHHGPQGVLARAWPAGSMVLWVAILLVVYLMVYYV